MIQKRDTKMILKVAQWEGDKDQSLSEEKMETCF